MSFEKLYKRSAELAISDGERKAVTLLLVEPDPTIRSSLKQTLMGLGIGTVADAADHAQALKKFEERPFSHVIFESKRTNMAAIEFLNKIAELDGKATIIACSWDPTVDNVFDLLIHGARGYLVKPFTKEAVEDALIMATKGEPISDSILFAKDRNEALAALVLSSLDKLATTMRQAQQFDTAKRDVTRRELGFKRAVDIGRTFAKGGVDFLLQSIVDFCIERGNGPASRLGRIRKRLEERKPNIGQSHGASKSMRESDSTVGEAEPTRDEDKTSSCPI